MRTELSRFLAHSGIYAFGNLLYRGASFVLVPLYVHYLTPAEYGTLEVLTVTGALIQTLLGAGVAHSVLRFYYEYTDQADRHRVVSSALIGSMVVALAGALLLAPFAGRISLKLFGTAEWATALRIILMTIAFEISREISLAYVRATERSWLFVGVSVCQLVLQVGMSLLTVVYWRLGALGIVIANLTTVIVIWALLTRHTLRECGIRVDWSKLRAIVQYGHPLMLSVIVSSLVGSSDRLFLNAYVSAAYTGVYALALRIVQAIPVLLVDPFTKSFGPFRFAIMRQENAGAIYARILLYFAALSGLAMVTLAALAPELVRLISDDDYAAAASVLPILLIPAALQGVIYIFQTGSYVQKRTKSILYANSITSALNFALNLLLIPRYHMFGAAIASACAAVANVFLTYAFAQRAVAIAYSPARALTLVGIAVLSGVGLTYASEQHYQAPLLGRLALVVAYAAVVFWFVDLKPSAVRGMWRQFSNPAPEAPRAQ
jgi:O-antigen/teichoic acid export membrane protein